LRYVVLLGPQLTNDKCERKMSEKIVRAPGSDLQGSIESPDGVYNFRLNRKAIFNRGMVANRVLMQRSPQACSTRLK
jgi:hypothetical protein